MHPALHHGSDSNLLYPHSCVAPRLLYTASAHADAGLLSPQTQRSSQYCPMAVLCRERVLLVAAHQMPPKNSEASPSVNTYLNRADSQQCTSHNSVIYWAWSCTLLCVVVGVFRWGGVSFKFSSLHGLFVGSPLREDM